MLVAAAVCPHPPLLVPEVARGAAGELAALRRDCEEAVAALAGSGARTLLVVGAGAADRTHPADARGDLSGYGVDAAAGGPGPARLPLSLTIGAWLLQRSGVAAAGFVELDPDASPQRCLERGRDLAAGTPGLALLAMGDGSARLGESSPGYLHPDAAGYDTEVATALAKADPAPLAALDPQDDGRLWVAGRPALQVLAGAAEGAALTGELLTYQAPYGVGYFVARWSATTHP